MNIQSDLQQVMDDIIVARDRLAGVEVSRVLRRRSVTQAEATLAAARIALMSRSDAGTNDAQRRAYAERETMRERVELERAEELLMRADCDAIEMAATLRSHEDHRRYLETVVKLMEIGAAEPTL